VNTDIRISISFPSHPKTVKLAKKLGPQGPLSLIYLWIFAAQNKPNGQLTGMDIDDICIAAQWPKESKTFIDALTSVKFISCENSTYTLHDWKDHNPYAVHSTERSEKAKKAAAARWGGSDAQKCPEHNQALPLASSSNAPSPAPIPSPNPNPKPAGAASEPPVDNPEPEEPPFDQNGDIKTPITDAPSERGSLKPKEQKATHGNIHGERWSEEEGKKFEELMIDIKSKLKPYPAQQVYKFAQTYYNRANPEAMNRCLGSIHNEIMKGAVIAKPFEWLVAALMGTKDGKAGENQKCEAAESERIHEALKADETRDVARMIGGIGRVIQ
jgi:hypothetical protein